jgi:uncharacterized protein (DUF58 family)
LPSGQSLTTQLPLTGLPRGRWRVEDMRLIGSDVLGLFNIQKRAVQRGEQNNGEEHAPGEASGEIVVGPMALPPPDSVAVPLVPARGDAGVPATRFLGQGDEVRGTRLYTAGDDLRHVHWKSTARKGQLVVKEFHHTLQSRSLVIWDGAQETNWGDPESTFNSLEWSLALTASLCRAMEERHQPCGLWCLDGAPLKIGQQNDARRAANGPLSNAALSMTQVSQALADAQANRETPLPQALASSFSPSGARHTEGGGAVYLVTASLAPDAPRAVRQLRAEGAQVSVALVNGAAFLPAPRGKFNLHAPQQHWQQSAGVEAGAAVVSIDAYAEQASNLRAAGARVIVVEPESASRHSLKPLRIALHTMLQENATPAVRRNEVAVKETMATVVRDAQAVGRS